jgi:hypothetical protein
MAHSYEEIRSATIEVLAGRVTTPYGADQFGHLKIGVGKALRLAKGLPEPPPARYAADEALDYADAETLMEVFWDLFRDGVITLGKDPANPEYPWFRVTGRGKAQLTGGSYYFLYDVAAFEQRVRGEIPKIDEVTLFYLKEALQSYRAGCILASTVMLGVATEHTFLLLLETIAKNAAEAPKFTAVDKEFTVLRKINRFRGIIDQNRAGLSRDIVEDFDTHFLAIQSLIRTFRNEAGHPSGKMIGREQAFVNLELFMPYGKKAYQLIDYFSRPSAKP